MKLVHKAVIRIKDWAEVEQWCLEHIGEWDQDWYRLGIDLAQLVVSIERGADDQTYETVWYFKDEQKMVMFLLRWA